MYIEKLALTHPEIKFTLTNNDKVIVSTSGSNNLLKTIYEIYGYLVSSNMISINASSEDYDINGYVCKPTILKSNRNHMTTIVNGRIVKNIELNKAINDAYYTYKPDIKYPIVVINIETDPTIIDVTWTAGGTTNKPKGNAYRTPSALAVLDGNAIYASSKPNLETAP